MTPLVKYWAARVFKDQEAQAVAIQGPTVTFQVCLAADVEKVVEEYEAELRESKAREVPLPSKHYTDEIINLKAELACMKAENEKLEAIIHFHAEGGGCCS